ncbi:MAG: hypothetical protein SGI74_10770 [Oligoflexia bacterium]|nr:hypothetical protein [Oligoflexia bacterium]
MKSFVFVWLIFISSVSFGGQAQLQDLLDKNQYKAALTQWNEFYPTEKSKNVPGVQALYSFVLFRNGLHVLALENLFLIKKVKDIPSGIQKAWANELVPSHPVLKKITLTWNNHWNGFFSKNTEFKIRAWNTHSLDNKKDIKDAQELLAKVDLSSEESAWLRWQLALGFGIIGQTSKASGLLQQLLDSEQQLIDHDQILMAAARMLYQDNKLDKSLRYYNLISKNSDYWLEALEEKAWIYTRSKQYEKALAELTTVLTPFFASQLGPEPYFLASFDNLKICDYNSIFKIIVEFKKRYRSRVVEIERLAHSGTSPEVTKALAKLQNGYVSLATLGPDVEKLPRFFNRDEILLRQITREKYLSEEVSVATKLEISEVIKTAKAHLDISKTEITKKIKLMAKVDMSEISKNLQKLQIVEVEAIQRMHANPKKSDEDKSFQKITDNNVIEFPYRDEIWLDELDHYQVNAKGCPAKEGKKL